jgi:predicted Zn-dependent protease
MIERICQTLENRTDIQGWTVREVQRQESQLYLVQQGVEARREVSDRSFQLDVIVPALDDEGQPAVGEGNAVLLPGEDISAAIDQAVAIGALVHNPPYGLVQPADIPQVPLVDAALKENMQGAAEAVAEQLSGLLAGQKGVRMTAAECYTEAQSRRLINSQGLDCQESGTTLYLEWVLLAEGRGELVESFGSLKRRRVEDLDLERQVDLACRMLLDRAQAGPAPQYQGPVVLQHEVLSEFMVGDELLGGALQQQSSAESKLARITQWEIGKDIFGAPAAGDSLTVWANRLYPYGTDSCSFDDEGLPARRLALIQDDKLRAFWGSQRHCCYLGLPSSGAFGVMEVQPGNLPRQELLQPPYVEVMAFSWFNPNLVTGDFATEIRLGYLVDEAGRHPFKGGMLAGNLFEALGNVRWSNETSFYGRYAGPTTARFGELRVDGDAQA